MKFKLLYVEESENNFADYLIENNDIELFLIRFSSYCYFSKKHLDKTRTIPQIYINKKDDFETTIKCVEEFIQKNGPMDYFYNDSEFNQIFVQKIARKLKLPGALSEKQALIVRDKAMMKEFLKTIEVPHQEYTEVSSENDILDAYNRWGSPVVVKIKDGVSSIGVYKIDRIEKIKELDIDYAENRYIVEKYNPNKIWCLDALVAKGEVIMNLYTWLPFTNLDFAENKEKFIQLSVGRPQKEWVFSAKEITGKIVSSLGLERGYLHLEAFIDNDNNASICEFAWRTPGDQIISNLSKVYGVNISEMLLGILMGQSVSVPEDNDKCVADVFLPIKKGRIKKITSLEELMETGLVIGGEVKHKSGDIADSEHRYTDSSGWVQVEAQGIDELLDKADKIYDLFNLEIM